MKRRRNRRDQPDCATCAGPHRTLRHELAANQQHIHDKRHLRSIQSTPSRNEAKSIRYRRWPYADYGASIMGRETPRPFGHTKNLPRNYPRPTRSKFSPSTEAAKHWSAP